MPPSLTLAHAVEAPVKVRPEEALALAVRRGDTVKFDEPERGLLGVGVGVGLRRAVAVGILLMLKVAEPLALALEEPLRPPPPASPPVLGEAVPVGEELPEPGRANAPPQGVPLCVGLMESVRVRSGVGVGRGLLRLADRVGVREAVELSVAVLEPVAVLEDVPVALRLSARAMSIATLGSLISAQAATPRFTCPTDPASSAYTTVPPVTTAVAVRLVEDCERAASNWYRHASAPQFPAALLRVTPTLPCP